MTRAGLKVKERKLAVQQPNKKLQGNQWQNTVQQRKFMENWLNDSSETFGNAYKSALQAGYSEHYARVITVQGVEWLNDFKGLSQLQLQHIEQKLISIIQGRITREDSNSPTDTRLKAIELYARVTGKMNDKNQVNVTIVQPILGGASVKGKIIDQQV